MNLTYTKRQGNSRLLLFFAGWSVTAADIHIDIPGYDTAVAWGFNDFTLPPIEGYSEVAVIAWSLGVHAAELILPAMHLPISVTIAVNGTPVPVSDTMGIPTEIYKATADNLDQRNLLKFRRRMGAADMAPCPVSIVQLQRELMQFPLQQVDFRWDHAVISLNDRIFPPENQRRAWAGRTTVFETDESHTPDFQSIAGRFIIDKQLVASRFARHSSTYAAEADVQHRSALQLWNLWQKHLRHAATPRSILEAGSGTGGFTSLYAPKLKPERLLLWDLNASPTQWGEVVSADAETSIATLPDSSIDAVVSASTLQWFNSPAGFLLQAQRVLTPGGLIVLSTYGPQTFQELTQASVTPLPYLSLDDLRRIIPAGMKTLELSSGLVKKIFNTPLDALRHIQLTGVNARPCNAPIRELLRLYPRRPDGRCSLTYQPEYLILQK